MKPLSLRLGTIGLCAGTMLAGCGQPQPPAQVLEAAPQDTAFPSAPTGIRPPGWISPAARNAARIYVADQGDSSVLIYSEAKGKLVGEITDGVSSPYGLYVDQHGTLYVTNWGNSTVTAYTAGSKSPATTWSQDLSYPMYPIVDADGDLFVSNQHNGTVVEYLSGSTSADEVLQTPGREADGMDFDSEGNLYVAYRTSDIKRSGGVEEFAPGSTQGKTLPMKLIAPQGLIVDRLGNILAVETGGRDRIVLFPPGRKYKTREVTVPGSAQSTLTELAIKAQEKELFASSLEGYVFTTAYPLPVSGVLSVLLRAPSTDQGLALSNGQTF
jgi:hypothetical protein